MTGTRNIVSTDVPVRVTCPIFQSDLNGSGNDSETPTVRSKSEIPDAPFARIGRTMSRSTISPVTMPTAMPARNDVHHGQPQSFTHFASSRALNVPIWAWARFRKRFDL